MDSASRSLCKRRCSTCAGSSYATNNGSHSGPLQEYPNERFGDEVPRSGNASGGGQPGWAVRTKGGGPNDYIYVIVQPQGWAPLAELIGRPDLADHPDWARPQDRLPKLDKVFALIEDWSERHTKWEALEALNALNIPCGPVLSTKELIEDETLTDLGAIVTVDHPGRGPFKTVGSPLRLSDSPVEIVRSPMLGEHTEEICTELGYSPEQLELFRGAGVI